MTETPADISGTEAMRVLFLCTHNSSRSQIAEGLLRARGREHYRVFSAGTHPRTVHPLAVKAMAELDIDISERAGHRAKGIEEFAEEPPMDLVVTVCDEAAEECPYFPVPDGRSTGGFPTRVVPPAPRKSVWRSFARCATTLPRGSMRFCTTRQRGQ